MKKYKRIYIEITNICNLSCSFCSKSKRTKKSMSLENFEKILKRIDHYTDYIYLHVKGEPLLHPHLKEILELCKKYDKKVTITTNGTLLKEKKNILLNCDAIRQINISLHCEHNKETYFEDIFESVEELAEKTNIVYRIWTLKEMILDSKSTKIVDKLMRNYQLSMETVEKLYMDSNVKLKDNLYVNKANQFLWPDVENEYENGSGYCHALQEQLAILVDGTVVPCCLDGEGEIKLGNILTTKLETILENPRIENMIQGFRNRQVTEELCRHCNFKDKF